MIQQWKEWLATNPDGKLPTDQKTEGQEEEEEKDEGERGGEYEEEFHVSFTALGTTDDKALSLTLHKYNLRVEIITEE